MHLFFKLLMPFVAGILILPHLSPAEHNLLCIILAILVIQYYLSISILERSNKASINPVTFSFICCIVFFYLGGLRVRQQTAINSGTYFSFKKNKFLKIYAVEDPKLNTNNVSFISRATSPYSSANEFSYSGNLLVQIRKPKSVINGNNETPFNDISYGSTFVIPARPMAIPPPSNAHEFDRQSWLARQQVFHQVFVAPDRLIRLSEINGNGLKRYALAMRKRQVVWLRKFMKNDEAFALAVTLILGYRSNLEKETISAYSKTGTIHALSVSGMHVGLVYLVLNSIIKILSIIIRFCNSVSLSFYTRLGVSHSKFSLLTSIGRNQLTRQAGRLLILLAGIWYYTILTGSSPAAVRSAIMLSLLVISNSLSRKVGGMHVLACSAFFHLWFEPVLLWDPGFQLSYLAVLGLIGIQPSLVRLKSFRNPLMRRIWEFLCMSVSAQVPTLPVCLFYFHQFPVLFLIANLFIAVPVTILMYSGLLILLFRLDYLVPAFEWLIIFINKGTSLISALPYSTVDGIYINLVQVILLYFAIGMVLLAFKNRSGPSIMLCLASAIIFQAIVSYDRVSRMRQTKVLRFSLSRGYAIAFVEGPDAEVITSLRSDDNAYRYHVQPALDHMGIKSSVFLNVKDLHTRFDVVAKNSFQSPKPVISRAGPHQIMFHQFKILILDSCFADKVIANTPSFDAIWVTDNAKYEAADCLKQLHFRQIWVDAGEQSGIFRKIQNFAIKSGHSDVILSKNKSYLNNLKHYKSLNQSQ